MRIVPRYLHWKTACLWLWLSAVGCHRSTVAHAETGMRAAPSGEIVAETRSSNTSLSEAVVAMARDAGVIFTGQVVSVSRLDKSGFADIRFHIDEAVRGCPATGFYVLREWEGLWTGHAERYRVGQRFLMLLTSRGPSGLSTPIGGSEGAIPILVGDQQPIADAAGLVPPDEGLSARDGVVDLRWIEARRMMRNAGTAASGMQHSSAVASAASEPEHQIWKPLSRTQLVQSVANGDVATHPSLRSIMALLQVSRGDVHVRP